MATIELLIIMRNCCGNVNCNDKPIDIIKVRKRCMQFNTTKYILSFGFACRGA